MGPDGIGSGAGEPAAMSSPPPYRPARARFLYFAFAWLCFGLGVLGTLLPVLPTTPFMLLALWGFSRSSRRFQAWLYGHRVFGPGLRAWHTDRVVPWSVKLTAYASMLASLSYTAFVADVHPAVPAAAAAVMLAGVWYLGRCPSRRPPAEDR